MTDFAAGLTRWMVRAVLFAAGVVLFLSLLTAALLLGLLWALRALWARLSGRPSVPWAMRFDPRDSWSAVYRTQARKTAGHASSTESDAKPGRRMHVLPGADEVVDVQPHAPRQTY